MVLQHNTSIPLHQQLSEVLHRDIQTGKYASGQKIPTEMELSQFYGVSRVTIRSALDSLVKEGLLVRMSRNISHDISFSEMCVQNGLVPGARTIKCVIEPANDDDLRELELTAPAQVVVLERIRYANGIPVAIECHRLPERYLFLLEEDLNNASLQQSVSARGITWHGFGKTIKMVYATYDVAKYLSVSLGYPLISIQALSFDTEGPAHRVTQLIVGDRIELHTT